jgi:hypothetical protein
VADTDKSMARHFLEILTITVLAENFPAQLAHKVR